MRPLVRSYGVISTLTLSPVPGVVGGVGLGGPSSRVFCRVACLGAKLPVIGLRGCGQHAVGEFAETLRPRPRDGRLAAQLFDRGDEVRTRPGFRAEPEQVAVLDLCIDQRPVPLPQAMGERSEEHTSEVKSLMRTPYAVF